MAETADMQIGEIHIAFTRPYTFGGVERPGLTMREPTVGDQLAAEAASKKSVDQEVCLLANLCEVTPDEIKTLSLRDYARLQKAFTGFFD